MSTELDYFKECAAIRRYTKRIFLVGAVFFVVEFMFLINNVAMSASGDLFNVRVIMEYLPNFWMQLLIIALYSMIIVVISLIMLTSIINIVRIKKYIKGFEKFIGDNELSIDDEHIRIKNGENEFYLNSSEVYYLIKKEQVAYYLDNRKEILFFINNDDNEEIYINISEKCKNLIKD